MLLAAGCMSCRRTGWHKTACHSGAHVKDERGRSPLNGPRWPRDGSMTRACTRYPMSRQGMQPAAHSTMALSSHVLKGHRPQPAVRRRRECSIAWRRSVRRSATIRFTGNLKIYAATCSPRFSNVREIDDIVINVLFSWLLLVSELAFIGIRIACK